MENLVDSEAFQQTLKSITTAEDMIRIFAQNGVEITAEDAEKFLQGRAKALEEDELAVDELDAVAGGKRADASSTVLQMVQWAEQRSLTAVSFTGSATLTADCSVNSHSRDVPFPETEKAPVIHESE